MRKKQTAKGDATKQRPTLRTRVGSGGSSSSPSPSKSAEGGSLGHGLLRRAILGTQLPDPPAVIKVVIPPEDLLRDWITKFTLLSYGSGTTVWDWSDFHRTHNLEQILEQVHDDVIASVVLSVAYGGSFTNPYQLIQSIKYDGLISKRLISHFAKSAPSSWSIPLLELVSRVGNAFDYLDQFKWRSERIYTVPMFDSLVSGAISPTQHSSDLYMFLGVLFFGRGIRVSYSLGFNDLVDSCKAQLMQGLIAQGKKGLFIWDFEGFMTKPE